MQDCFQIGKALCIPPEAVLIGLVTVTSFLLSPAEVHVPGTEWHEPVLVWLSVNMPTGSSKSSLYQFLLNLVTAIRNECGCTVRDPFWLLGDASCEKIGDLMALNGGCLLGLYDELSTFLTQLNLYRSKALNLTHELALFLQLYNGHPWTRATGTLVFLTNNHIGHNVYYLLYCLTGDANFSMESTCLTPAGGFSQPTVARSLKEQSGSSEIALAQRILWAFPKPTYAKYDSLEAVKQDFSKKLGT